MSHFSVLVIGDDIDNMLAPYQENNTGTCPKEYMKFFNVEEEMKTKYETDEMYPENYCYNKLFIDEHDLNRLKKEKNNVLIQNILCKNGFFGSKIELNKIYPVSNVDFHIVPLSIHKKNENFSIITLKKIEEVKKTKIKDKMSFIEYIESYCGYQFCHENQSFGYYENPNAKWDWFSIGGRWSNFFKLKEKGKYSDSALVRDIDFDGMRTNAANNAKKHYEVIENLMGGTIPTIEKSWEQCIKEYTNENGDFNRIDALNFYNNQEGVKNFNRAIDNITEEKGKKLGIDILSIRFYGRIDNYQITKEEYINNAYNSAISTFALVKDGKWYEKGEMGWFGISTDKVSSSVWNSKINELLNSLDDNTLITIIDCHI